MLDLAVASLCLGFPSISSLLYQVIAKGALPCSLILSFVRLEGLLHLCAVQGGRGGWLNLGNGCVGISAVKGGVDAVALVCDS